MLGRTALLNKIVNKRGILSLAQVKCLSTSQVLDKNVAVVLTGCGVYDGTEVHEASACLAALTRGGADPVIYAPETDQAHVVDHQSGQEMPQTRGVMNESARIARGPVRPLSQLTSADAEAIIVPGGFGAAKNLCDFGFKGADMTVNPEVERVLKDFHSAGKPIGLCCIAPIIASKVLGSNGVKITLGKAGDPDKWPYGGSLEAAASFGANIEHCEVSEVCVDEENKVVTSPAFMYNGKFHEIQDGVSNMVNAVLNMLP